MSDSATAQAGRPTALTRGLLELAKRVWYMLALPFSIAIILGSTAIHPAYRVGWFRRTGLGLRMFWNKLRIPTGTSYQAHLAMALKLLELPPEIEGDVVECGCCYSHQTQWPGATWPLMAQMRGL